MNIGKCFQVVVYMLCTSSVLAIDWDNFKGEDYEEAAGASFALLANTQDDIYGFSFGDGTWLKHTPVFGDYFLSLLSNKKEDAWYSAVGMTIRLMPHWRFAPFVGGGGSYNFSLSQVSKDDTSSETKEFEDQGDSYWGGHVEAGFRVWTAERRLLFEVMGRNTWTSLDGDRNYWLAGISIGAGFGN
jgi:hypothetical protein